MDIWGDWQDSEFQVESEPDEEETDYEQEETDLEETHGDEDSEEIILEESEQEEQAIEQELDDQLIIASKTGNIRDVEQLLHVGTTERARLLALNEALSNDHEEIADLLLTYQQELTSTQSRSKRLIQGQRRRPRVETKRDRIAWLGGETGSAFDLTVPYGVSPMMDLVHDFIDGRISREEFRDSFQHFDR